MLASVLSCTCIRLVSLPPHKAILRPTLCVSNANFFFLIQYQHFSSSCPHHSWSFLPDLSSSSTSVDVVDAVGHRLQSTPPSTSRHTTTTTTTTSHIDPSRVTVSGPGVRLVSVSSQAEFTVSNPQPLRQEEVNVKITGTDVVSLGYSSMPSPSFSLFSLYTTNYLYITFPFLLITVITAVSPVPLV